MQTSEGVSSQLKSNTCRHCIQDTLSSRAALGLPAVQPLGRVRRASKGVLHTSAGTAQGSQIGQKLRRP